MALILIEPNRSVLVCPAWLLPLQSVATATAQAFSTAVAQGCGGQAQASSSAVEQTFASAAASAEAAVQASRGSAQAAAQSISKDIQPAVANAIASALSACKCGGGDGTLLAGAGTAPQPLAPSSEATTASVGGTEQEGEGTQGDGCQQVTLLRLRRWCIQNGGAWL